MRRLVHFASPLIAAGLLSITSWALYRELRNYHWSEFRDSLAEIPLSHLATALAFAVLDYTILVGNDRLASRFVQRRVPLAELAAGSIAGYAASHNLGAALGGTPVRYRYYASWGLQPNEMAIWIGMLSMSFVLGATSLGAVTCLGHAADSPEILNLPPTGMRLLGAVLLVVPLTYAALCVAGRSLHWRGRTLHLPSGKFAALQIAVGSADLCCAAAILYVLLPTGESPHYFTFISVYLLAAVAGVCSHVPGGIGVFDLTLLKTLDHGDRHDLLAALLVYRFVYYLLPLAIGLLLFAAHELKTRTASRANVEVPSS